MVERERKKEKDLLVCVESGHAGMSLWSKHSEGRGNKIAMNSRPVHVSGWVSGQYGLQNEMTLSLNKHTIKPTNQKNENDSLNKKPPGFLIFEVLTLKWYFIWFSLLFWDMISQFSPAWPKTHGDSLVSASGLLGLQVCTTTADLKLYFM